MSRTSQERMIELINQILQFRSFISRKDSGKLLKKMLPKVQFFQRNFSLKKSKRTEEKRRESITETDEIFEETKKERFISREKLKRTWPTRRNSRAAKKTAVPRKSRFLEQTRGARVSSAQRRSRNGREPRREL